MTKITAVRSTGLEYRIANGRAYGNARGLTPIRIATVVEVEAADGVIGLGEAWGPPTVVKAYVDLLRPHFEGREIFDFNQIRHTLYAKLYHSGIQNPMTSAMSAINVALYDIHAKLLGVPLCKLLGGKRLDRVPAYASTGYYSNDDTYGIAQQLEIGKAHRYPGTKIKIGASVKSDVERVKLAREMIGPDRLLMVDANGNLTVDQTLESMRAIAPFDVHWYEEPLPPHDFTGYTELTARAPMRVATGEALYTVHDFKRLTDGRCAHVLQPDITLCGGLDETLAIAGMAYMENVHMEPHVWGGAVGLATAVHFLAASPASPHTENLPHPAMLEYDRGENPLRDDLLKEPIAETDGWLTVPDKPGLGIELDPAVMKRFAVC